VSDVDPIELLVTAPALLWIWGRGLEQFAAGVERLVLTVRTLRHRRTP
jgi:hypothetical protein